MPLFLRTGQIRCHDAAGRDVPCAGTGQDGEFLSGRPWPEPRFEPEGPGLVLDRLTGLVWTRDTNPAELPLTWAEAFDHVLAMNRDRAHGHGDWRVPNRRELRSLLSHGEKNPALPRGHPFVNVFLGWRWTSTTSAMAPAYAWHVHLEGARMFYGNKDGYGLLWPVRGAGTGLPRTGQEACFDAAGRKIPCAGTGQDGELRLGEPWPEPRFVDIPGFGGAVLDRLTGLAWRREADLTSRPVTWQEGLDSVARLNRSEGVLSWRLPNVNELESLVDASTHTPALPRGHPFASTRESYWSSTSSAFGTDWAYALYLHKGAVGVGHKAGPEFHVWPVATWPGPADSRVSPGPA